MSQLLTHYPSIAPGLCGALECPHVCSRVTHCPAGLRRVRRLLAEREAHRATIRPNKQQLQRCDRIRKAAQCPSICNQVGGCFLPRPGDHPSEARRKAYRSQHAINLLVAMEARQ